VKSRLQFIDCLRASAALAVCIGHGIVSGRWTEIQSSWFQATCQVLTTIGSLGVPLFFVISGFCIHLTYARARRAGQPAWPHFRFASFWKRRLWRLYPTYFVVLCASMLLLTVLYVRNPGNPQTFDYPDPKPLWMTWDFLAHAAMAHGFFPVFDKAGGNPPFWTLAREEYLYALYPVLLLSRRWAGVWVTAAVIFIAGAYAQAHVNMVSAALPKFGENLLSYWILWTLGVVAAEAYVGDIRVPWILRSFWAAALWAAAAVYYPSTRVVDLYPRLDIALYGVSFLALINWGVAREARVGPSRLRAITALAEIGTMSYSLYLVHSPVQEITMGVAGRLGTFDTPAMYLLRVAGLVVSSLIVGRLLFVAFESRFLYARHEPEVEPDAALNPLHI